MLAKLFSPLSLLNNARHITQPGTRCIDFLVSYMCDMLQSTRWSCSRRGDPNTLCARIILAKGYDWLNSFFHCTKVEIMCSAKGKTRQTSSTCNLTLLMYLACVTNLLLCWQTQVSCVTEIFLYIVYSVDTLIYNLLY